MGAWDATISHLPSTCPLHLNLSSLFQPALFSQARDQGLASHTYFPILTLLPQQHHLPSQKRSAGQSQWTQLAVHWPTQVLTLIWEERGARNLFPTQNWLLSIPSWDIWKAPLMPESMQAWFKWFRRQKATNSRHFYRFSHCYKFSEPAIISGRLLSGNSWGLWSLARLGWDSKNVPIGNLEQWSSGAAARKRAKVASKLQNLHPLDHPPPVCIDTPLLLVSGQYLDSS